MPSHSNDILRAFILLFAIIDPIGTVPIFLSVTSRIEKQARRKIAFRAVAIAAGILLFFIIVGQILIEHMDISLPAFQVAGGLVLLVFALSMIFRNDSHGTSAAISTEEELRHAAVFPLAIPAIASPGAILAVVLLTDNHVYTVAQQAITTSIVLLVLGIVLGLLLMADKIQRTIGTTGITVVTKIMGLLLCGIAAESILAGIKAYFS
jgi:multiple antibiotic resistance protein